MAFIRVEPVTVQVRTDWFNGRPREITWGDERLPITRLAVVREEAAAYPVISGPRTLFEVDTPRARLSLTFQHRSRRWTVTGLEAIPGSFPVTLAVSALIAVAGVSRMYGACTDTTFEAEYTAAAPRQDNATAR